MNAEYRADTSYSDDELKLEFQRKNIHPDYFVSANLLSRSPRKIISPKRTKQSSSLGNIFTNQTYWQLFGATLALVGVLGGAIIFSRASHFSLRLPEKVESQSPKVKLASSENALYEERFTRLSTAFGQIVQTLKRHNQILSASGLQIPERKGLSSFDDVGAAEIVRVSVPKAVLRIRPAKNSSAMMAIAEGTELLVDERAGEWIRVIAPNGNALWIASNIVTIIPLNPSSISKNQMR